MTALGTPRALRIAVVGGGIAGLGSAWLLHKQGHRVTVFEAAGRLGGHVNTVDVTLEGITHPVDTGFLVFNDRTYPLLLQLFAELGVGSVASEMSFSVRDDTTGLEWAGTHLAALFAQPRNALSPRFWHMLADIARFNRTATALQTAAAVPQVPLSEFLARGRYGNAFRDAYLLPMAAAIWSSPRREVLDFPLPAFVRFCHNHGLLQLADRPQWRTVQGGGRVYVQKIAECLNDLRVDTPVRRIRRLGHGVVIDSAARSGEVFDAVVVACHSDQARALIADPAPEETRLLSQVRYQSNRVVLHTDPSLMPRARRAWAAWNYLAAADDDGSRPVAVSYLINKLQPLPFTRPVIVTLNPPVDPDPVQVLGEWDYEHPLLDGHAIAAQRGFDARQGERRTWFAGAWLGYGFHEDGLRAAHAAASSIAACSHRLHLPLRATAERFAA